MDRQYHIDISHAEVHRIGESRQHGTTSLPVNAREDERTVGNAVDHSIQLLAELPPQVGTLRLVPLTHFNRLVFSFRPEDDFQSQRSALELGAHLGPRNGRGRILLVLSPASIKFCPIRVRQLERTLTFSLTETFPQSDRELGSVTGRELEKFRQRTRRHEAIVARRAR